MPHSKPPAPSPMADPLRPEVFGFAWYEEADYPEIRRIMADGDRLPARFGDWLQRAQQQAQRIEDDGGRVVRVIVKPEAFTAWCALRGLNVDADGRMAFASEQAARQMRGV